MKISSILNMISRFHVNRFRSVNYVESLSDFIDSEDEFAPSTRKTPKRKEAGKLTRSAR